MAAEDQLIATNVLSAARGPVTLAGLLALGRFPQQWFPQLNLTFVRYVEADGGTADSGVRFIDNVTLDGPITAMAQDLQIALRRNMARRASVSGMARRDTWEYPEAAIREAVVNALVHRDLSPSARGTQVQVEMYPDRLVVRNPGGLHGPVALDQLGEGVSSSRNASLMRILEDVTIPGEAAAVCENRGSGIRTMLAALRSAGLQPPEFRDSISAFSVAFPNHALLSEEVVQWIASLGEDGLTKTQVLGLALLRRGATLDNPSYRAATGVDSRIATGELQDLVARELVQQHGTKRWARYTLADSGAVQAPPVSGFRRKPADRRTQILQALGGDTLSRAELAKLTGLHDRVVRHWLKVLRDEGAVERTTPKTQNIHAKYRALRPGQPSLFDAER